MSPQGTSYVLTTVEVDSNTDLELSPLVHHKFQIIYIYIYNTFVYMIYE